VVPTYRGTRAIDTLYMVFALHTVGGRGWRKRLSVLPPNYVTCHVSPHRYFDWMTSTKGARLRPLLIASEKKKAIRTAQPLARPHAVLRSSRECFHRPFYQIIERVAHLIYTSSGIACSTTRVVRCAHDSHLAAASPCTPHNEDSAYTSFTPVRVHSAFDFIF